METYALALLVHGRAFVLTLIVGRCRKDTVGLARLGLHDGSLLEGGDGSVQRGHILAFNTVQRILQGIIGLGRGIAHAPADALGKQFLGFHHGLLGCGILLRFDVVLGIGVALCIENLVVALQAAVEAYPTLLLDRKPSHLSQRKHTGEQLVLQLFVVVESLCPEIRLCSPAVLFFSCEVGHGVERVDALNSVRSPTTIVGFVDEHLALGHLREVDIYV